MAFDYAQFGEAGEVLETNAVRLDKAAAAGLRPPPRMSVSEWAAEYRYFPDDAPVPGKWQHAEAPYLVEIMDALSPHDPCEEVIIIKCAQSGGTASIENWLGYISDLAPGPMMFVQSTLKAALEWAGEKFWPMVEATPRLNPKKGGTIKALGTPDGDGSTKHKIRFARSNGFVLLAGGNSGPSLRQRTVRYAVEDDLDQFPDDVDKQGSPEKMVDQRLKVYRRKGLSKRAKISTPTIKGASKIEAAHGADGVDRRRFHYKCPHCADRFAIVWEPQADGERDIQWPEDKPDEAYLVPRCCGTVIEHWQKKDMSEPDGWLSETIDGETTPLTMDEATFQSWRARMPQSRKRGFDIDGMLTSFQTWADMAVEFVACLGDLNKLKGWTMLTRGAPYELRGSTPDFEKLKELKEEGWGRVILPFGPVAITIGCDVQGDGIYVEKLGHAENAETWSIDQQFIPGATDVKGEGAWAALEAYVERPVVCPGGLTFPVDQVMVDAGYNTDAAHAFCARRPNRLAIFGRSGWNRPVLGRGENLVIEHQGSRTGHASKRSDDKAYLVGVDGVKLSFYGYLRATIRAAKAEKAGEPLEFKPRGLCHFHADTPDEWFEMITAEAITVSTVNGYPRKKWEPLPGRQNHYLDCRIYNYAAAQKLMLDTLSDADWARLRAERYAPRDPNQGDLLARLTSVAPQAAVPADPPPAAAPPERFIDADPEFF